MGRQYMTRNVFEAGYSRLRKVYEEGHRVVVAFSAGKDSGVCLELAIMAARDTGRLPVEAMLRDDEIYYPGTAEFALRSYERKEVRLHWLSSRNATANVYNREIPYYWVYDERLSSDKWVRQPPHFIEWTTNNINLYTIINSTQFPPEPGKLLCAVVGIRAQESMKRLYTIHSIKGSRSFAPDDPQVFNIYPIYDWSDGDVWKSIADNKWDYNEAYDVLNKMGVPRAKQRIAQAAMTHIGTEVLQVAAHAWPRWFDKVSDRLPGIRQVVYYGDRVLKPQRKISETWEETFYRECITDAPAWIAKRSQFAIDKLLSHHSTHSDKPFPDVSPCKACASNDIASWKGLAHALYAGDAHHIKVDFLPSMSPYEFRPEDTRYKDGYIMSHKKTTTFMEDNK